MLLLDTAVATDMGEQGEQLRREGQHLPPMWSVREGADGHKQLLARSGGQMARQRGGKGSADRSDGRRSSPEVCMNACRCEKAWGTRGGMRRTCASATRCVCKSAPR